MTPTELPSKALFDLRDDVQREVERRVQTYLTVMGLPSMRRIEMGPWVHTSLEEEIVTFSIAVMDFRTHGEATIEIRVPLRAFEAQVKE